MSDYPGFFGNPDQPGPEEEIAFEDPLSENPNAEITDDTETFPCDHISILSEELDEAMAGEEYHFPFSIQSNCQQVTCSLVAAPEWMELNGCELNVIPASHETLGQHDLRVRVFGHNHETTFAEGTFTLIVRDEPSIALFVANREFSEKTEEKIAGADSNEDPYTITLSRHALYARIQGHADNYTVELDSGLLVSEAVDEKVYKISPLANVLGKNQNDNLLSDLTISAEDEFGNSVQREFDLHIFKNPCDDPLEITPIIVRKMDGESSLNRVEEIRPSLSLSHLAEMETDVILDTEYEILLHVTGGEGPYVWNFDSQIVPKGGCLFTNIGHWGSYVPGCMDTATTNANWEPTPVTLQNQTPEELEQKTYYQLETHFSFPNQALLWSVDSNETLASSIGLPPATSYTLMDRLQVTVETQACNNQNAQPERKSYVLNHQLQLPWEGVEDIQCEQEIDDVKQTSDYSRAFLHFKKRGQKIGSTEYKINECRVPPLATLEEKEEAEQNCEKAHRAVATDGQSSSVSVDEINGIEIEFQDDVSKDLYCFDCDDDEADYDLISLTCYTKYRSFRFEDVGEGPMQSGGMINENVVEDSSRNDLVPIAGGPEINSRSYRLSPHILSPREHGLWAPRVLPGDSFSN